MTRYDLLCPNSGYNNETALCQSLTDVNACTKLNYCIRSKHHSSNFTATLFCWNCIQLLKCFPFWPRYTSENINNKVKSNRMFVFALSTLFL